MLRAMYEYGEPRRNDIDTKTEELGETCPSATLSTTIPTRTDPGLRGERLATNRLSYVPAVENVSEAIETENEVSIWNSLSFPPLAVQWRV
jgi:hypothetical protein